MSCYLSRCELDTLMASTGAAAWGVAKLSEVDPQADRLFHAWLDDGCGASMDWLARYPEMRRDPRLLLPGARSIIVAAFPYRPAGERPKPRLPISLYALGNDYHTALRDRLQPAADHLAQARICIDSAPLRERYWAVKAGLGAIGRNNLLIIPGLGSMNFLACILTTIEIETGNHPELPAGHLCRHCGAPCRRACPTGAIRPDATIDARRCIAYLTIEHRGPFPEATDLHGHLFGCDDCALACPYNQLPLPEGHPIAELHPRPDTMTLSPESIATTSARAFARQFASSPLARARLDSLRRNLALLQQKE
ncbi:MAG: DUF1730 domain-containing protein [Pseudoflavonifractor sp.]|nr:DUF1730 domain-containing protein [Alloprevotella sp.]MCM1117140.1 DUF1730 domain-containing protein [Pseudoflavonifractor sp.]